MTPEEYARIRLLLDSLDDVCEKAAEIRTKLEAEMSKTSLWRDHRDVSHLFNRTPQAFGNRTPGSDDSAES